MGRWGRPFRKLGRFGMLLVMRLASKSLIGALVVFMTHSATAADAGRAFTDRDLARLLDTAGRGAIYLWSPHMPYSLRGAVEAKHLLEGLGLTAVLLLDPRAESSMAQRARRTHRLPDDAMRRIRADALWRIGATQHYPTVVVFAAGRLDTQMLPGYTTPSVLSSYIHHRLQNF